MKPDGDDDDKLVIACLAALERIMRRHKTTGDMSGSVTCTAPGCLGHVHFRGVRRNAREVHWRAKCSTPGCVEFIQ